MTDAWGSDRLQRLSNLYPARLLCFKRLGGLSDLRSALSHYREVGSLISSTDPYWPGFLSNLGAAQITQFACLEKGADLEDAIRNLFEATDLTTKSYSSKPANLLNFGSA